jgi:hypothetical protein
LSEAGTKTSSAAEEMTAKARELIERARKMTAELVGSFTASTEREDGTAHEPGKAGPSRTGRTNEAARKPASAAGPRPAAKRKAKVEKKRKSNARRAPGGGPSRRR